MLEHLFGSNTRLELLRLLVKKPNKVYFVRELARELDVQVNAIRRELNLLKQANLIKEVEEPDKVDTSKPGAALRKYYGTNSDSSLFEELQALILKEQVLNEQQLIKEIVDEGGEVKFFLVTGQFTSNQDVPTDLLIVGDIKKKTIKDKISEHEEEFDSNINYTLMKEEEFLERHHIMDKFLYNLFESDHIKVVNELNV